MAAWDVCGEAVWVLSASAGGRRHICLCGDGIISSQGNQSALLLSAAFPFFLFLAQSFYFFLPLSVAPCCLPLSCGVTGIMVLSFRSIVLILMAIHL